MSTQMALTYNDAWQNSAIWAECVEIIREIVAARGPKQVAYDLDCSPSALAHALAGRERHHVKGEWVPYLLRQPGGERLLSKFCSLSGYDMPQRKREFTAAEQLERIRAELAKNPALEKLVMEGAGLK